MRSPLYILTLFLLAAPVYANTADPNGYVAAYECRAGGPHCNVDVASLASRACDRIVLPSDRDWSKITANPSANVFCIQAGDHSSKGPLTINFSGTASNYKVLRYYRPGDSNDEPWRQSVANQARIDRLKFDGAHYWIVHRLVFDPNYANTSAIWLAGNTNRSTHIIINRVLAQRGFNQIYVEGAHDSHIQNSVLRDSIRRVGMDSNGIGLSYNPRRIYIVNNEIYRIYSHGVYTSQNSNADGTVLENNDIYVDASQFSDCRGNYTPNNPDSPCSAAEGAISLKAGSTSGANPLKVIHNRIWGARWTDTNLCCISGGAGQIVSISSADITDPGARNVLVQNNIISEGQYGILVTREGPRNNSVIGNIIYGVRDYKGINSAPGIGAFGRFDYSEAYFNTIIDSFRWTELGSGNTGLDMKCNAVIASGSHTGAADGSAIVNYNAFIGTAKLTTDAGIDTNIALDLKLRGNSSSYNEGQIVQLAPIGACTTGREPACFLYSAVNAGVSGPGTPAACTSLGCEFRDGSVTWKAVRGPFFYKRKLRTVVGGETAFIPYARVHVSAPESRACDPEIGTRTGSGIDDMPLL